MTSEDIKTYQPHLGRESYDLAMCQWLQEIAFQLATQNERAENSNPPKIYAEPVKAVSEGRTGPEYTDYERQGFWDPRIPGAREQWNLTAELARAQGELDAANRHVKILQAGRTGLESPIRTHFVMLANILRSCAQTIFENAMGPIDARDYLLKYAETVAVSEKDSVASTERAEQHQPNQPGEPSAKTGGSRHDPASEETGPDWNCPTCHWVNYAIRKRCRNCLNRRPEPARG